MFSAALRFSSTSTIGVNYVANWLFKLEDKMFDSLLCY